MQKVKVGVVIGRFQGYHKHHHDHIRRAALENDVLVVVIGSCNARTSIKNPFSVHDRVAMISSNIICDTATEYKVVKYCYANDNISNDVWADEIKKNVHQYGHEVTLYGCDKDDSTFYFKLFSEWKLSLTTDVSGFSATDLRKAWFQTHQTGYGMEKFPNIPEPTVRFLQKRGKFSSDLQKEWDYYLGEKETFKDYPFPESLNFNCADAVVVHNDMVLFIQRKFVPGKGCWALPGGFKNANETFLDAAVRELEEETNMSLRKKDLMKYYVGSKLFDNPHRSLGIPRNTMAAYFDISELAHDSIVTKASDDAMATRWIARKDAQIMSSIYDDHNFIVQHYFENIKGKQHVSE